MNNERNDLPKEKWSTEDEQVLASLIRESGARLQPPSPAGFDDIRPAVHAAWQDKVRSRNRKPARRWLAVAVAASILILTGLAIQIVRDSGIAPAETVAVLAAQWGSVHIDSTVAAGAEISSGSVVTTLDGRALLHLPTGESLRIAEQSRIVLETAGTLILEQGTIYIDSGADATTGHHLAIETPHGIVRDIGTQFEVRLEQDQLLVRVREGIVEVKQNGAVHSANAGQQLVVNGKTEISDIQIYGDSWSWILSTTLPLEIEGESLFRFLEWVTRESGWSLDFSDPALELETTTP